MRKLISLGGLYMWDLVQKLGGNRAIENEIAIEQLDFLNSLVPL